MAVAFSEALTSQESSDRELLDLVYPLQHTAIGIESCEPGYLYYGQGRAGGHALGICHVSELPDGRRGDVRFVKLDIASGQDCLRSEVHVDADAPLGTWLPYVRLEKVPEGLNETSLLSWLIDQELAMHEEKLAWCTAMPGRLKQASWYEEYLHTARRDYERALYKKARGVSPITELSHSEFVRKRFAEIAAKNAAAPRIATTPN